MTREVLSDLINHGLDAMNIDIKGDNEMVKKYCGIDNEKVWNNIIFAKQHGVHVEITTLLLEDFNTDEHTIRTISERIVNELGEDTPFHISKAFPHYKSFEYSFSQPTPNRSLYKAQEIAKKSGLNYLYLGNIINTEYQNTKCPNCSHIVIERNSFSISQIKLNKRGECEFCGHFISKI